MSRWDYSRFVSKVSHLLIRNGWREKEKNSDLKKFWINEVLVEMISHFHVDVPFDGVVAEVENKHDAISIFSSSYISNLEWAKCKKAENILQ